MNLRAKFCEKILLVVPLHPEVAVVPIIYKPHQIKEAKQCEEQLNNSSFASVSYQYKLIEVENKGFKLSYGGFRSKNYGAIIEVHLSHPEFQNYPEFQSQSISISIDLPTFHSILSSGVFDFGEYCKTTFSFDLFNNSWYKDAYKLVPDNLNNIPQRIFNYKLFWENPKQSALKPGEIYLDRWGDLYLALSDKVWTERIGNGYSGGVGNYSMYYNWSVLNYSERKPATIMAYLGNSLNIVPILKDSCTSLELFQEVLSAIFKKTFKMPLDTDASEDFQSYSTLGRNILRIKGYSNGHFVKVDEVPNYTSLYKSIGGWCGLRNLILKTSLTSVPEIRDEEGLCDLETFFYVTDSKTEPMLLSHEEKLIYKEYILKIIQDWIKKPLINYYHSEEFKDIYETGVKEIQKDRINEFLVNRANRDSNIRLDGHTYWTIDNFISLGIFDNSEELVTNFNKIRNDEQNKK